MKILEQEISAFRDTLILCCVNLCTSLLAGFVVFSVLGFMATASGKTVAEVVKSGLFLKLFDVHFIKFRISRCGTEL